MAFLFDNSHFLFCSCCLFLLSSCTPFVYSLSTVSISETGNQTLICSLNQQSLLNCSSYPSGIRIPLNYSRPLSAIVAGDGFVCGLITFTTPPISFILCWRFSANGANMRFKQIYEGPTLTELRAGNSRICGLVGATNRLECWQWPRFDRNSTLNFSSIAVGGDFLCGLSKIGEINCTGSNSSGVVSVEPSGGYRVVAAGFRHVCAIKLNDELVCWGDMVGKNPQGQFKALALGENRSCALRSNGTVVCWGENNFTLPESLRGEFFLAIEAKRSVFCGVMRVNSSLLCWGNEIFDRNFRVFEHVLPGPCSTQCPCGPLANTGGFCNQGMMICRPCEEGISHPDGAPAPAPPPPQPSQSPPPPPSSDQSSGGHWSGRMVALLVVGCVGSLSLLLVSSFFLFKYCKTRACRVHDSGPLDEPGSATEHGSAQHRPQAQPGPGDRVLDKRLSHLVSLGNGGQLEDFPLPVLLEATNNFSDDHKIGTGSFGSVYRAVLRDGREVAIKRAETTAIASSVWGTRRQEDKDNAFLNELESLSRINHKNLVRLLGFFDDSHERVLVYEYMNNGTLHDHLHKRESSPLTTSWARRITVALDAARGIQYLHDFLVPSIIHRDIKSSNILLDAKWTAKVSDFGLSLMGPDDDASHLSLRAAGTVGYMDPEYFRLQQLTTKSDVYSFGVVLLELLSGYKAIHKNENGVPRNVVDVMVPYIVRDEIHRVLDPKVPPPTPFEIEAVKYVGYLAADCVISEGRHRPTMTDIVNCLERALAACLAPTTLSRSSTESST